MRHSQASIKGLQLSVVLFCRPKFYHGPQKDFQDWKCSTYSMQNKYDSQRLTFLSHYLSHKLLRSFWVRKIMVFPRYRLPVRILKFLGRSHTFPVTDLYDVNYGFCGAYTKGFWKISSCGLAADWVDLTVVCDCIFRPFIYTLSEVRMWWESQLSIAISGRKEELACTS